MLFKSDLLGVVNTQQLFDCRHELLSCQEHFEIIKCCIVVGNILINKVIFLQVHAVFYGITLLRFSKYYENSRFNSNETLWLDKFKTDTGNHVLT